MAGLGSFPHQWLHTSLSDRFREKTTALFRGRALPHHQHFPMTSETPSLTIGELEANYSLYCKAMRLLIIEGRSLKKIQRTVCWQRLEILHKCLPNRYKSPDYLCALLKREVEQLKEQQEAAATATAAAVAL